VAWDVVVAVDKVSPRQVFTVQVWQSSDLAIGPRSTIAALFGGWFDYAVECRRDVRHDC
jgi:hypothetical protein